MRIVKEYPHPVYKVSIFRSAGRHHVKIQDKRISITYTLSDDQCGSVGEVEKWIEKEVIASTAKIFPQLEGIAITGLKAMEKDRGETEINII